MDFFRALLSNLWLGRFRVHAELCEDLHRFQDYHPCYRITFRHHTTGLLCIEVYIGMQNDALCIELTVLSHTSLIVVFPERHVITADEIKLRAIQEVQKVRRPVQVQDILEIAASVMANGYIPTHIILPGYRVTSLDAVSVETEHSLEEYPENRPSFQ